ncbi:MAG: DNA polymerase III subunit beta [Paludibacteraceae bacterium]|nr:DNA polymerase III subunit beta [Paludibacteraceae bacterium]
MKFNVSSTKLFAQLQAISRIIAPKNSLKILEDVLFELGDNMLTMTASDGETTIHTSLDVENLEGEGKVAFGAKLMLETLKEFPEQPLTFQIDNQNFSLNITSSNGTYSLVGENGDAYPQMASEDKDLGSFTMSAEVLLNAINKTLFCVAEDEFRPVINGVYFSVQTDQAIVVATDAHRLVRYINTSVSAEQPVNFILPKRPAMLLKNVLNKESDEVVITFGEHNAQFQFGRTTIACRQIDGIYPNYSAIIPQVNEYKVTVDRQTIINACKRVAVFANTSSSLLKLALSENTVTVSAQDIDFSTSAEEMVSCSYSGAPMAIGFKANFLIEMFNQIETEEVMIELSDPQRAALILSPENNEKEDVLMLLMPMMLNE